MARFLTKRLRWVIILGCVILSLIAYWSYKRYQECQLYKQRIIVVNVPSLFISTTHLIKTAHALADLNPGTTTTLEIHFPRNFGILGGGCKEIEFPIPYVESGTITFQGGNLSLSYSTNQRLGFCFLSEKYDGVLFAESHPYVGFHPDTAYFSGFYGPLHRWAQSEDGIPVRGNNVEIRPVFCKLPTQFSILEGVTTITVSLSPDFQGTMMGEVSCFRDF